MNSAREKLIIALDDLDRNEVFSVIEKTKAYAQTFKIGLALFSAYGPALVKDINNLGVDVFLDLKLHDIPMQVSEAVKRCISLGPRFLTIHTLGGPHMMAAAKEAAKDCGTKLLAVTVLTSIDQETWPLLGFTGSIQDGVSRLANLAISLGLSGLVSSPHEVSDIKKRHGNKAFVATPGVRPLKNGAHDQARIMTPSMAIKAGADALVVGRPITEAENMAEAARNIAQEIYEAQSFYASV